MIEAMDGGPQLDNLRRNALALLRMGIKDVSALNALIDVWKAENEWRIGSMTPEVLVKYQSKRMAENKKLPKASKAKGMVTVEYERRVPGEEPKTVREVISRLEYKTGLRLGIKYRIVED
jgi:hypothetical protein